ncbi:hypothetical protein B7C42_01603 [Nocardia cerradoensis]|uniref:Uncharacterized protein n=1 Tax=Nocardia cerradoensis TaxID=85688 RepID=A0A231HCR9_9NOCA|nr:hypothetical protein [Nocardia cerradoensis]OXR46629.1 hypothetical protein B7C42_01603 [Nocardia cerradoensis]
MGTISASEELDGSIEDLPAETVAAARRVVAHNATDAGDCARLLDMLGLRPKPCDHRLVEPYRRRRPNKTSAKCACGRYVRADGETECSICRRSVPDDEFRAVIARIRGAGLTLRQIAERAGLNYNGLMTALSASRRGSRVGRDRFDAVAELAEAVGV